MVALFMCKNMEVALHKLNMCLSTLFQQLWYKLLQCTTQYAQLNTLNAHCNNSLVDWDEPIVLHHQLS